MASSFMLRSIIHSSTLRRLRRRCGRRLRCRARRSPSTVTLSPAQERRDWAALHPDLLWEVFRRLPTADNLRGTGRACAAWRRFSVHEPSLWRRIDLLLFTEDDDDSRRGERRRIAMGRAALARSAGRCEAFSGHADADFLYHIAARAPLLRSLHVRSRGVHMPAGHLIHRVVERLPLLERLVLSRVVMCDRVVAALLDHCPRLQLLDLGGCGTVSPDTEKGMRLREQCRRAIKAFTPAPWVPELQVYVARYNTTMNTDSIMDWMDTN